MIKNNYKDSENTSLGGWHKASFDFYRQINGNSKLLDIGCGDGGFLLYM